MKRFEIHRVLIGLAMFSSGIGRVYHLAKESRMRASNLICAAILAFGIPLVAVADEDLLTVLKEAVKPAQPITSAKAEGRFKRFKPTPGNNDWQLAEEAAVTACYLGDKYLVDLKFNSPNREYDRRIVIYDGSDLYVSSFSPRIHPVGAEAQMSDARPDEMGVRPAMGGFPWDITKLNEGLLNFDLILKHIDKDKIELSRDDAGDISGKYPLGAKCKVTFVAPKSSGHRVFEMQCWNEGSDKPAQEDRIEWRKSGDAWFAGSRYSSMLFSEGGGYREELTWIDFQPNAEVKEAEFTLEALQLPGGARLLDQRANVPANQRVRRPVGPR